MRRVGSPVHITVLMDDTAGDPRLFAEHGFSVWLECGPQRVLFDAGQDPHIVNNAKSLGIDLAEADAIAVSHGHYDHTGGLAHILPAATRARIFVHPDAFGPRFSRKDDGSVREIGMPADVAQAIRRSGRATCTMGPTEIADGLFVSGRIPRANNFEDSGGSFFLDSACTRTDPLDDDQALYFRCSQGLVVVLGCAHAGVVNTIDHVRAITDGWSVHAVVGGMHLRSASRQRLCATIDALRERDVRLLAPAHCTGSDAVQLFHRGLPGRIVQCHVCSRFSFE